MTFIDFASTIQPRGITKNVKMPRILDNIEILDVKPRKLLPNVLPTALHVLRAIQYAKKTSNANARTAWRTFERDVAKEVHDIWNKASIPTTHFNQLVKKIIKLNKEFLLLLNADLARKDKENYIQKVNEFRVSFFLYESNSYSSSSRIQFDHCFLVFLAGVI